LFFLKSNKSLNTINTLKHSKLIIANAYNLNFLDINFLLDILNKTILKIKEEINESAK